MPSYPPLATSPARSLARLSLLGLLIACTACRRTKPTPSAGSDAAARSATGASRPIIVWISLESLRADHLGCYGYHRPTTPALDALAAEGTVYTRADSVTSWTLTSHASMFTGLYPSAHGVIHPRERLADEHITVAEVLQAAGYQTAAVVAGPYLSATHNLPQGFELLDDSPIQHAKGASADITNPDLEAALFRFLDGGRDGRPLLLFAYYWDTHSEYIPPPPFDTMFVPEGAQPIQNVQYMPAFELGRHITQPQLDWLIAQYDGEIRCTDGYLGRLFEKLKALGLWDNSMVLVTADHGEEFYEHGRNSHKNSVYVESVHVPLIVKWPAGGTERPRRDDRLVSLVDLFPTLLEVAGCSTDAPLAGRSLRAAPDPERATFLELETLWSYQRKSSGEKWLERTSWSGIRTARHKLLHVTPREDHPDKPLVERWEFYDTVADPGELHPLTADPELLGEFQGRLAEWQRTMALLARRWETGPARLSPEEEARLRSLGYLP